MTQNPNVGKQFQQLPMFMTAHEIKSQYRPWQADRRAVEVPDPDIGHTYRMETDSELWDRKAREAPDHGLTKTSVKHGIHTPVPLLEGREVWDGHHRVAAAAVHTPDSLIPVEHYG